MKYLSLIVVGGLASLIGPAQAQTLYVYDGAAAVVRELTGPSDSSFCGYPDGPVFSAFPTQTDFPCTLPGPIVSPLHGDIAVNRGDDRIWVTDGRVFGEFDPQGVPTSGFSLPPGVLQSEVQGVGFDGLAGSLWLTDGKSAVEVRPPSVPCGQVAILSGPFTIPPLSAAGSSITDIDMAPQSGRLWVCDDQGNVGTFSPGSTTVLVFPLAPGICNLSPKLLGLTVDSSTQAFDVLYITDGLRIANVVSSGSPAPQTFGSPFSCFPVPSGAVCGVGFSARPITYGDGGGLSSAPDMSSKGQAVIPTQSLSINLRNGSPGAIAMLPFTQNPLCPSISVASAPILIMPPAFAVATRVVDPQGEAVLPLSLPTTMTVGLEVMYQWFVLGGGPSPDGPPLVSSGAGSLRAGFR